MHLFLHHFTILCPIAQYMLDFHIHIPATADAVAINSATFAWGLMSLSFCCMPTTLSNVFIYRKSLAYKWFTSTLSMNLRFHNMVVPPPSLPLPLPPLPSLCMMLIFDMFDIKLSSFIYWHRFRSIAFTPDLIAYTDNVIVFARWWWWRHIRTPHKTLSQTKLVRINLRVRNCLFHIHIQHSAAQLKLHRHRYLLL